MKIERSRNVADETVVLDDTNFIDCTFTGCALVYSGGDVNFAGLITMAEVSFEWQGAAWNTVNLLQRFHLLPPNAATRNGDAKAH